MDQKMGATVQAMDHSLWFWCLKTEDLRTCRIVTRLTAFLTGG